MRVFVAGATGAIGRPLVRQLMAAGHEVTALTRSPEKADDLRALGARPVVCDALERRALHEAVVGARPDAVVHQLTQFPHDLNPKRYAEQFVVTDRLRTEATRTLVEAALAAGARRLVAQSIALVYAPTGAPVKSEDDPLQSKAAPGFERSLGAIRDLERLVTETEGIDGIVLRYGYFYGPGTSYAPGGPMAERVRRRRLPIVGGGTGVWSFVHVEDAAAATVLALAAGRPGVYNVVDGEPARVSEWLPAYAAALGAKAPARVPSAVGRLGAGRGGVEAMTNARGASNEKAKRELGWDPRYPSWREGFMASAGWPR
jgi:nucleoside-diphosphate-sugar epimerase